MAWFENLKTSRKLVGAFGCMILLMVAMSWFGLSAADAMRANQQATYEVDVKTALLAGEVTTERQSVSRIVRDAIIERNAAKVDEFRSQASAADARYRESLARLARIVTDAKTQDGLAEAAREYSDYLSATREAIGAAAHGDAPGDPARLDAARGEMIRLGNAIDARLHDVTRSVEASAAARAQASQERYDENRRLSVLLTGVGIAFAACCSFAINRAVTAPLRQAVTVLRRIGAGDLTARLEIHRRDELGQLAVGLNGSMDAMRDTLRGVRDVATQVADSSSDLAAGASQLSTGAQSQAASLEETASSLEEIRATVKQNSDSAQQAAQLASGARETAERGGKVVELAVNAMAEITSSSRKIADIITTIDEIAFQTNLLALNAAVEAARAGEQGRGFGVVAAEVRALAQRSASAAKQIRGLIADSTGKVEAGTHQVNQSGETLVEIVRSIKRVTEMVSEIAAASREQHAGVDQVNSAVNEVDQVTQGNAAQTEVLSATATSLSDKAQELQELVASFELGAADHDPRPRSVAVVQRGPSRRVGQRPPPLPPEVEPAPDSGVHVSMRPFPRPSRRAVGMDEF